MAALLELDQLCIAPLNAFSAQLNRGDIVALWGASGSGKSRLLYAIADLVPHTGHALLKQKNASRYSPSRWRQQVMLVPSRIEWWEETALDHFAKKPDNDLLSQLNISATLLTQPVAELSTGQKQRLGILRALVRSPQVLLLDEPTANLDEKNVLAVEAIIKDWVKRSDRAVIWCSHDQQQISRIADRSWQINDCDVVEKTL